LVAKLKRATGRSATLEREAAGLDSAEEENAPLRIIVEEAMAAAAAVAVGHRMAFGLIGCSVCS
jgi:hypothetical protein